MNKYDLTYMDIELRERARNRWHIAALVVVFFLMGVVI